MRLVKKLYCIFSFVILVLSFNMVASQEHGGLLTLLFSGQDCYQKEGILINSKHVAIILTSKEFDLIQEGSIALFVPNKDDQEKLNKEDLPKIKTNNMILVDKVWPVSNQLDSRLKDKSPVLVVLELRKDYVGQEPAIFYNGSDKICSGKEVYIHPDQKEVYKISTSEELRRDYYVSCVYQYCRDNNIEKAYFKKNNSGRLQLNDLAQIDQTLADPKAKVIAFDSFVVAKQKNFKIDSYTGQISHNIYCTTKQPNILKETCIYSVIPNTKKRYICGLSLYGYNPFVDFQNGVSYYINSMLCCSSKILTDYMDENNIAYKSYNPSKEHKSKVKKTYVKEKQNTGIVKLSVTEENKKKAAAEAILINKNHILLLLSEERVEKLKKKSTKAEIVYKKYNYSPENNSEKILVEERVSVEKWQDNLLNEPLNFKGEKRTLVIGKLSKSIDLKPAILFSGKNDSFKEMKFSLLSYNEMPCKEKEIYDLVDQKKLETATSMSIIWAHFLEGNKSDFFKAIKGETLFTEKGMEYTSSTKLVLDKINFDPLILSKLLPERKFTISLPTLTAKLAYTPFQVHKEYKTFELLPVTKLSKDNRTVMIMGLPVASYAPTMKLKNSSNKDQEYYINTTIYCPMSKIINALKKKKIQYNFCDDLNQLSGAKKKTNSPIKTIKTKDIKTKKNVLLSKNKTKPKQKNKNKILKIKPFKCTIINNDCWSVEIDDFYISKGNGLYVILNSKNIDLNKPVLVKQIKGMEYWATQKRVIDIFSKNCYQLVLEKLGEFSLYDGGNPLAKYSDGILYIRKKSMWYKLSSNKLVSLN